mmetsp:Transcript_26413/g.36485  ORF Transcript_26413/g.36485 Transcript_26413/m.36485 type:complete len:142 (-) Transcript_26413:35-460(-)|eukprot:CAMPEP_0196590602 /NCGR_PEP_ID=MMETSP1081-20130531/67057_1 /TAXON_ID=36882 /ORGANISM="Pyramimonas amylifera, Strain CCMP720" /LENGTH=141 /DNA_ID=CAMNT_0041913753 /DNA_START=97 /DNA_END=522 /DNA_ORIENTATION=+
MTTARGRVVQEEEDAAEIKLGAEFDQARCLMISEVSVVLETYLSRRKEEAPDEQPNPLFEKCLEYCKTFNRFENPEVVPSVRELLSSHDLYEFEVGVIGNLVPDSAAEAKALVPSLVDDRELSDESIDQMLRTLATFKSLQ